MARHAGERIYLRFCMSACVGECITPSAHNTELIYLLQFIMLAFCVV